MNDIPLDTFKTSPFGSEIHINNILEDFEFLDDWEDRYSYIIDMGKSLPPFPDSQKNENNLVHGCQSQVWLISQQDPVNQQLYLMIESDALIVKGLAAIVLATLNRLTPKEILAYDVEAIFEKIDLLRHISPTRGNGLRSMLDLVKNIARNS